MSTVQHVYSGNGDPNLITLQAAPGSHYIDNTNPYDLWMTTDGAYWIRITGDWPPSFSSGTYAVGAADTFPHDVYMTSGELLVSNNLIVRANVAMESHTNVNGEWLRYGSTGAFRAQAVTSPDGQMTLVTITSFQEQIFA